MDEVIEKHFKKGENLVEYFKREQDPADPDKYNLVSRIIDDEKGIITVKTEGSSGGIYKVKINDTYNIDGEDIVNAEIVSKYRRSKRKFK